MAPLLGLTFVLSIAAGPASAQEWGLKAGVQWTTFAVSPSPGPQSAQRMPALVAGLFNVLGDGRVAPQLDVLLSVKGAHLTTNGVTADYVITYAELPVLVRVELMRSGPNRIYAVGGPYLGSRWAARGRYPDSSVDIKDQIQRYDLGWTAGGGVFLDRLVLDVRYTHGLRNVDTTLHDDASLKNRTFALTAGWVF